jgi:hypothetical protein
MESISLKICGVSLEKGQRIKMHGPLHNARAHLTDDLSQDLEEKSNYRALFNLVE